MSRNGKAAWSLEARAAAGGALRPPWRRWLSLALSVAGERRALARLTAAELRDIGLSPDQARREAERPIWDLPHRRR